jgi:hypothetical protein
MMDAEQQQPPRQTRGTVLVMPPRGPQQPAPGRQAPPPGQEPAEPAEEPGYGHGV